MTLSLPANALDINLAPLFYLHTNEKEYTCNILGPVIEWSSDHRAIRPLFYTDASDTDILYPLGYFTNDHSRFFPLYSSRKGKDESNHAFFPYFSGQYKGKKYSGIFPVYGRMYHRYGLDEAVFALWPLYTRTQRDHMNRYTFLWPIFRYSPHHELQVFPLAGIEKDEEQTSYYALWPLLHHRRGTQDMDAFLPFFLYSRQDQAMSLSVIWPLFTYNRDYQRGHTSVDILWPLGRYASGAYEETRIFPLYWSKKETNSSMKTILWPIYRHSYRNNTKAGSMEEKTSILILSSMYEWQGPDSYKKELHVWPLWHSSETDEGFSWHFPNILPFTDSGFVRNILPLTTLASGDKTDTQDNTDILWHTINFSKKGEGKRIVLSFLFSYEWNTQYKEISLFFDTIHIKWSR